MQVNETKVAVSEDGITRNTNIVPEGLADGVAFQRTELVERPIKLASIPPQLKDWQYLTTLSITAEVLATGAAFNPYDLFLELDYVKRVLTGRVAGKLCLELRFSAQPTAYHYGVLLFGWLPNVNRRPTAWNVAPQLLSAAYVASRKHQARIDFGKPEVVTLSCPIVLPSGPVQNLTNHMTPSTAWTTSAGQVWYNAMTGNLYRQDGAYTTVGVEVMCRLTEDSDVYGLTGAQFYSISSKAEGPLSAALGALGAGLGAGASYAGGRFSGFLSPLQAVAKLGAGVASKLGLGVPVVPNLEAASGIAVSGGPINCDIQNRGYMMSTSAVTSRALTMAGGDADVDECDVKTVVARYGMIAILTVAAADAQGAVLGSIEVSPCFQASTVPISTGTYFNPPSAVGWLASYCNFWRGSLVYRVSVVSSKYHSGRIRVTYEPDPYMSTTTPITLAAQTHCYSEVFDIAEGTVVEFEVPWTSAFPWAYTREAPVDTLPAAVYTRVVRAFNNGFLVFTVESALASVAASPSSIYLVVEVKGGASFEVACPLPSQAGLIPISAKVGSTADVLPRMLGEGVPYIEPTASCMGETITSLRQLVKLMQPLGEPRDAAPAVGADKDVVWVNNVGPWIDSDLGSGAILSSDNIASAAHPLVYFRQGFGLVSGGIRYRLTRGAINGFDSAMSQLGQDVSHGVVAAVSEHFDKDQIDTLPAGMDFIQDVGATNVVNTLVPYVMTNGPYVVQNLNVGALEFTVPMRGPLYGLPGFASAAGDVDTGEGCMQARLGIAAQTTSLSACGLVLSAGAADDYNLVYYDGPPLLQVADV